MFLEDGRLVTLLGKIVRSRQAGRTGADDGDFLVPLSQLVGLDDDLGDEAGLFEEVALGDELLDFIDGDGFVDGAAGTGFFALAVTDTTADCRERVLSLDELESLVIAAFLGHLQVTLDGDVRRAGRLTGSGTGLVALFAVLVSVVRGPAIFEPDVIGGIVTEFIGLLGTVFALQLLTETDSAGRAVLDTAAAGDTVVRVDFRGVSGCFHVRGVEQHGGTKGVTDLDVAVADGEDLVLTVNVRDLVDKAVLFGLFQDAVNFFFGDVVGTGGLGLAAVVCEVAHGNTPVVRVVGAADAALCALKTAGAGADAVMAVVLLDPVGDVLDVDGLVLGLDGLLDGDDVHTGAGAALGDHLSQTHGPETGERKVSGQFEHFGEFRMIFIPLGMLVQDLSTAGNVVLDGVLLDMLGVLPVPLDDAVVAHLFQFVVEIILIETGQSLDLFEGLGLAEAHSEHDGGAVFIDDGFQTIVVRCTTVEFLEHTVGRDVSRLHEVGSRIVGTIVTKLMFSVVSDSAAKGFLRSKEIFLGLQVCHIRSPFPYSSSPSTYAARILVTGLRSTSMKVAGLPTFRNSILS